MTAKSGHDHSRRFGPPLDSKLVERSTDPLIDGVRADPEAARDFLAVEMLVDKQQAFHLARAQARNRG